MEIKKNDAFEMIYENRYKVFSLEMRAKYIDELYETHKIRGCQENILKNSPKYQYSEDRQEGYILSQGTDKEGYYAIFLPTENEYAKIKEFAEIKDKIVKLSELAELQRQLISRNKTLLELNSIENKIDELYIDIFKNITTYNTDKLINKSEIINSYTYKNEKEYNRHNNIFSNNGFELFSYILENYITKNKGRYADISYYYWRMYKDKPKLIHQRPESFKKWFCQTYQEDFEKIRTLIEVTDQKGNRNKHYSTSLDWFNNQS